MEKQFELDFWGGSDGIRYRRHHRSLAAAASEALNVLAKMENRGAHPAMIHNSGGKQVATIR